MELDEIVIRPVRATEEARYEELMQRHHYLGALPKISETLWYVASWGEAWVALVSFSASALKCAARDRWIGWDFRQRYRRLKLVANNSRFLILPEWHAPNLGSRVLALCQRRVGRDWEETFGHGLVLLETFVDPERFRGTVYRAANWTYVGNTRGFRRTRSLNRDLTSGDIVVFYRTASGGSAWYTSVATTVGVVQSIITNIHDQDHFVHLCRTRSVFSDLVLWQCIGTIIQEQAICS